jgi:hypothetical protein
MNVATIVLARMLIEQLCPVFRMNNMQPLNAADVNAVFQDTRRDSGAMPLQHCTVQGQDHSTSRRRLPQNLEASPTNRHPVAYQDSAKAFCKAARGC